MRETQVLKQVAQDTQQCVAELSLAGQLTAESVLLSATLYLSFKKQGIVHDLGHVDPQNFFCSQGLGLKQKEKTQQWYLACPKSSQNPACFLKR